MILLLLMIGYMIFGIASPWLVRCLVNRAYTVDDAFEASMWLFLWPLVWVVGAIAESFRFVIDLIVELMP